MTCDVFDYNDRVIDHKPGRNGQRHQRKIVQAVTETDTSRRKSRSVMSEQRQPESALRARFARKIKTTRTTSRTAMTSVRSTSNADARIVCVLSRTDLHVDRSRHRRFKRRQRCFHSIDGLDDVCARLPKDDQRNGRFAIEVTGSTNVLDRVPHARDVRQPYRRAISGTRRSAAHTLSL